VLNRRGIKTKKATLQVAFLKSGEDGARTF